MEADAWLVTWQVHGLPYHLERFSNEDATFQATWLAEHGREEVKVIPFEVEVDEERMEALHDRILRALERDDVFRTCGRS